MMSESTVVDKGVPEGYSDRAYSEDLVEGVKDVRRSEGAPLEDRS